MPPTQTTQATVFCALLSYFAVQVIVDCEHNVSNGNTNANNSITSEFVVTCDRLKSIVVLLESIVQYISNMSTMC